MKSKRNQVQCPASLVSLSLVRETPWSPSATMICCADGEGRQWFLSHCSFNIKLTSLCYGALLCLTPCSFFSSCHECHKLWRLMKADLLGTMTGGSVQGAVRYMQTLLFMVLLFSQLFHLEVSVNQAIDLASQGHSCVALGANCIYLMAGRPCLAD